MVNDDVEIDIINGDISFRRYREKEKNNILLDVLKDLFSDHDFKHVESWVRALEGLEGTNIHMEGIDSDIIYCG